MPGEKKEREKEEKKREPQVLILPRCQQAGKKYEKPHLVRSLFLLSCKSPPVAPTAAEEVGGDVVKLCELLACGCFFVGWGEPVSFSRLIFALPLPFHHSLLLRQNRVTHNSFPKRGMPPSLCIPPSHPRTHHNTSWGPPSTPTPSFCTPSF